RATRANLSPIFSLFSDREGRAATALGPHTGGTPWAEVTDDDGNRHRLWRVADPAAMAGVTAALAPAELLIADGHHRYETARAGLPRAGHRSHRGPAAQGGARPGRRGHRPPPRLRLRARRRPGPRPRRRRHLRRRVLHGPDAGRADPRGGRGR